MNNNELIIRTMLIRKYFKYLERKIILHEGPHIKLDSDKKGRRARKKKESEINLHNVASHLYQGREDI